MKRCPTCRRDYFDDSLSFCLDDGDRLLEGPSPDEPQTEFLSGSAVFGDAETKQFDNRTTGENLPTLAQSTKRIRLLAVAGGALILVALLAWGAYTLSGRGESGQIASIAVMPFVNASGNPDIEYLSDGITESLINSLSQIPALSVKARSSVFAYKGKDMMPQQVAKDLSVQAVLNGRVVQRGDQVVLNLELVDAATGNQLWGEQYSRKMTDLVQLQNEIARDVSGKLRSKLTGGGQGPKNYTGNTEAYQLYLRGRYHWNKRTPEDVKKSIEYFQQAIDKDPTYALAYAAIAEAYILVAGYGVESQAENYLKARAAATKALEIDNSLAEAHNALAAVLNGHEWKFAEAEAEWRKAIELNPNYASAHQWYGEFLITMGRYDEALTEMRRAQELDPLSLIINSKLGITLSNNGRHEEALVQLRKTLEMDPNFPYTHIFFAVVYARMGRFDDAVDEYARLSLMGGRSPEQTAQQAERVKSATRAGGEKAFSRAVAELLEGKAPTGVVAGLWGRAGELDKAFAVLEKAYREHDGGVLMLKDPEFDPLKADRRYTDLMRRVGLPE